MTTEELMAEVARLRDTLKRIEALVWYEPQDDDDTVEAVRAMVRERDKARSDLARCREVQKATAEGWRHEVAEVAAIVGAPAHTAELAACVRADVEKLRRERDEQIAEAAWWRATARDKGYSAREVAKERDKERAEVSRREREHEALLETAQKALAHVASERDEARAEIERLRGALAQAQRADE